MTQTIDRIALHPAHGASVEIGPDRLAAVPRLGLHKGFGDLIQRIVPGNLLPLPCPLGAGAAQGMHQAVGMVEPLGITGDLGADDA